MIKTDKTIESFESILERYRFVDPVPVDVQNRMLRSKKAIFINVLKKVGKYSIAVALFQSIYFLLKKLGLSIYAAKVVVSAVAITAVAGGSYTVARYLQEKPAIIAPAEETAPELIKKRAAHKRAKPVKKAVTAPDFRVGIARFTGEAGPSVLKGLAGDIKKELNTIKGNEFSKVFYSSAVKDVDFSLFGSVEKTGDQFMMTVKLVDLKTSSIVHIAREKAGSLEGLNTSVSKLARKIAEKID